MNFTPKNIVGPAIGGLLAVAVIGWFSHVATVSRPVIALQEHVEASDLIPIVPAVDVSTDGPAEYQPVKSWYKRKSWWKKNAPIIGGAGGGALVGGLVGGGKGAVIGGAAGGGGGYLYKRHKHKKAYKYRQQR